MDSVSVTSDAEPSNAFGQRLAARVASPLRARRTGGAPSLVGAIGRASVGFGLVVGRSQAGRPHVALHELNTLALRPPAGFWPFSEAEPSIARAAHLGADSAVQPIARAVRSGTSPGPPPPTWTDRVLSSRQGNTARRAPVSVAVPPQPGQVELPTDSKFDRMRKLFEARTGVDVLTGEAADALPGRVDRDAVADAAPPTAEPLLSGRGDTRGGRSTGPGQLAASMRPEPFDGTRVHIERTGGLPGSSAPRPPSAGNQPRSPGARPTPPAAPQSGQQQRPSNVRQSTSTRARQGGRQTESRLDVARRLMSDVGATPLSADGLTADDSTRPGRAADNDGPVRRAVAPAGTQRREQRSEAPPNWPTDSTGAPTQGSQAKVEHATTDAARTVAVDDRAQVTPPRHAQRSPGNEPEVPTATTARAARPGRRGDVDAPPQASPPSATSTPADLPATQRGAPERVADGRLASMRLRAERTLSGRSSFIERRDAEGSTDEGPASIAPPAVLATPPQEHEADLVSRTSTLVIDEPAAAATTPGVSPVLRTRHNQSVGADNAFTASRNNAARPATAARTLRSSRPMPHLPTFAAEDSSVVIRRVTLPRAFSVRHRPFPKHRDHTPNVIIGGVGLPGSDSDRVDHDRSSAGRSGSSNIVRPTVDAVGPSTPRRVATLASVVERRLVEAVDGTSNPSPIQRTANQQHPGRSVVAPGPGALLNALDSRAAAARSATEQRTTTRNSEHPTAPTAAARLTNARTDAVVTPHDLGRADVDGLDRPGPPATDLADRFMTELSRTIQRRPDPLPMPFRPMAQAIAGSRNVMLSTDPASRRALRSVGKVAATTADVIHLDPDQLPTTKVGEVIAHELTHVAHPSPRPRFFDDIDDSPEERKAEQVAAAMARSALNPSASTLTAPSAKPGASPARRTIRRSTTNTTTATAPAAAASVAVPSSTATDSVSASALAAQIAGSAPSSSQTVQRFVDEKRADAPPGQPLDQLLSTRDGKAIDPEEWFKEQLSRNFSGLMHMIEDRLIEEFERRGGRHWGGL